MGWRPRTAPEAAGAPRPPVPASRGGEGERQWEGKVTEREGKKEGDKEGNKEGEREINDNLSPAISPSSSELFRCHSR